MLTLALDTPCTAASHLRTRDPEVWQLWFGDRQGCAQTPTLDKAPDVVSIPKLKVIFNQLFLVFFVPNFSLRIDRLKV